MQQYAEALQCPEGVSSAHFARDYYYSYDVNVLLFITAGPITKLFTWWGRRVEDIGRTGLGFVTWGSRGSLLEQSPMG